MRRRLARAFEDGTSTATASRFADESLLRRSFWAPSRASLDDPRDSRPADVVDLREWHARERAHAKSREA